MGLRPMRLLLAPALFLVACGPASTPGPTRVEVSPETCLNDPACTWPMYSAHRGKCGLVQEPENTLAAYLACADAGVPMMEIDTQVSADGHVVLNHDSDLERTTDAEVKFPGRTAVKQLTLAELRTLVVTDPRCEGATPEPLRCRLTTLGELLDAAPAVALMIDYKSGALDPFFALVREKNAQRRLLFFDGNLDVLAQVHAALPEVALMPRITSADEGVALLDGTTLPIRWLHGDPGYVKDLAARVKDRGVRVYADIWHLDAEYLITETRPPEEQAAHVAATALPKLKALIRDGLAGIGTEYAGPMTRALYPDGWGVTVTP